MKAIIEVDVSDFQIGQEVSIYFPDTMMIKAVAKPIKIGHWERKYNSYTLEYWYKCSECQTSWEYKFKYCPNCGVKMEGRINND